MRLITYEGPGGSGRAGVRVGHRVLDIEAASRVKGEPLPSSVRGLLAAGRGALSRVQALAKAAVTEAGSFTQALLEERAIRLLPPIPDASPIVGPGDIARPWSQAGLVGHDARLACPAGVQAMGFEPRLAFVIGRPTEGASADDALDYVAGLTILLAFPEHAVIGPDLVSMDEIAGAEDLWMTCLVNGERRLRAATRGQVDRFCAFLGQTSSRAALEAGDMVDAGAMAGGEAIAARAGDVVECTLEGVATLRATILPSAGA